MPIDPVLTQSFVDNPREFLDKRYVKVRNQASLAATSTWTTLGGGPAASKALGSVIGNLQLAAVNVTADDCLVITSIGMGPLPTCYVGIEKVDGKPDFFDAVISPNLLPGYQEIFFLPARVNQITAIVLPQNAGPDVVMTDPLTGCTVYFGTIGASQALCHANALAVVDAHKNQYMKSLKNTLSAGGGGVAVFTNQQKLKKGTYRADITALVTQAEADKVNRGRTIVAAQGNWYTTVVAIRSSGSWSAFYQNYASVKSTRTGLKRVLMGKESHKSRVNVTPL
jgi:hypothetical protein